MSHFTTVQTKIHDIVCLKEALKDLGFEFTEAKAGEKVHVRGYLGNKAEADLSIHVSKTYDVGVRVTSKGVRFVADWWGVETTRGIDEQEFVKLVTKRYSYHKVKKELANKGYTIATEEETEDQSIHIKVRRY
ncbi:MAG: DUF1257 domain-containing protein [Deltaproteobacteria bacterium]|nr:DUF1257 domain-containing protein [Deltaproteobacteria bacterium]